MNPQTTYITTLSEQAIEQIESSQGWRKDRVERITLNEPHGIVEVIVKGQRPRRSALPYKFLSLIAMALRSPYAVGVPMHGEARSQVIELSRLDALAAADCPVPRVLQRATDYFVMESLGATPLGHVLGSTATSIADKQALWQQALLAIHQVHKKNQYLSQCFARNILLQNGTIFFIDFEDDALEVMSLPCAQVRDWLIFLQSTVWLTQLDIDWLSAAFKTVLSQENHETQHLFTLAAKRLSIGRHLPKNRKPWGKDVIQMQAVGQLLWQFCKNKQTLD